MLKSTPEWEAFERDYIRRSPPDYHRSVQVFEAMYELVCALKVFPLANPLEGLEEDIQLIRDIESLNKPSTKAQPTSTSPHIDPRQRS